MSHATRSRRSRRIIAALALLLTLAVPLAAQASPLRAESTSGFFTALWRRLAAPLISLWAADTDPTADPAPPPPPPPPPVDSDGRSVIDPLG
jgi:hypothetical protein